MLLIILPFLWKQKSTNRYLTCVTTDWAISEIPTYSISFHFCRPLLSASRGAVRPRFYATANANRAYLRNAACFLSDTRVAVGRRGRLDKGHQDQECPVNKQNIHKCVIALKETISTWRMVHVMYASRWSQYYGKTCMYNVAGWKHTWALLYRNI